MFHSGFFSGRGREERKEKKKAKGLMAGAGSSSTAQFSNRSGTLHAPNGTLSQASISAMNRSQTTPSLNLFTHSKPLTSSIRPVPPESLQVNTSSDGHQNHSKTEVPLLIQPDRAVSPFINPFLSPTKTLPVASGIVRTISSEFGPSRVYTQPHKSEETHGSRSTSPGSSQWSSAVGHASQGKSGRVIERLMAENDMLKREVKIQQISADNAREEKKLAEEKQRTLADEINKALHDAVITKTLLKKRDRQFTELQAQIDAERAKTDAALVRERGWKDEMERAITESKKAVLRTVTEANAKVERSLAECKVKVDKEKEYSTMMEGRVKIMEDYWEEQTEAVTSTVESLGEQIAGIMLQREEDVGKMKLLETLCQQHDARFETFMKDREHLMAVHEAYKAEQEEALRDIKTKAVEQGPKNDQVLDESQRVLGELKWALNLRENVRDPQ
ncbi:hypothetical protein D0Z07_5687 [Hyphodiscus hymeniophilus]|uniref:SWI5-dependent HO expression protein 3 n=1 Tax=Hyphodiscus hymeniophilus TaxID=353542 RepID=A0A9P7AWA9_9HELO|nr:hypothetical protein D0Z07_5687 [Hyphodiscus hymeniophilus]